ncbi:hypothetical protein [Falsiroseomonas sp. E2-1-a20]|uniref:hypothetical protein n=1 Tax=Falsiroseomonas sp. E2-1-a20 TaxID=3239300 RepID=UPI003F3B50BC
MHVSANALWFQISFSVEPRYRPAWPQAVHALPARLQAGLALAMRPAEPGLEDLSAARLTDIGLPKDWVSTTWHGPARLIDKARRSLDAPF